MANSLRLMTYASTFFPRLLDFMSVFSPPSFFLPPPSSSSSPRCQTSSASRHAQCSLPDLNRDPLRRVLNREPLRPVFPAGPQLRPAVPSVPCRTSTATLCGLPGLNCDLLCAAFPAGPQPRPSALSVPCRTSTAR